MFSLTRVIGAVPVGALQPTEVQIVGDFACIGAAGGVPIELRLTAPPGVPATVFTATTSTGAPGMPPVDSVVIPVPWTGGHCGEKISFEVRGFCNGMWTAWQQFSSDIACLCPRIADLQVTYGACSGTPLKQSVTVTATVMLNPVPGTTTVICEFGDNSIGSQTLPNPATFNVVQMVSFQHDYDPSGGPYRLCLHVGECPRICTKIQPSCQECCDEVTVSIDSQPLPCLPAGGGPAVVQFSASIAPPGCTGPFEWKVTNLTTGTVLQPFTPGGSTFSYAFGSTAQYKVNVRVPQGSDCDDAVLTDSVTFSLAPCGPCAVSVSGPQQTPCTDAAPTPVQTYTATTTSPFAGPYTWEVTKQPTPLPMYQTQGGASFSYAFPGPGTYTINVSLQTQGCTNPTASSSVTVIVPSCVCPPGQHLDPNGNCVPDTTTGCPPGQHLDASGNCVPDTPPACPPGQHRDAAGNCVADSRIGCDALLWISLILIAISGVLAIIGCVISNAYPIPAAVIGIIALALLVIGLVLFLLWWAICRFFTACSVIIAALHFMGTLIIVFAVIAAVLALVAKIGLRPDLYLCVGVAFFQSVIWGILLYILYRIAVAVKCITENPNGPPPPAPLSSSSSGLRSAGGGRALERPWLGSSMQAMAGPRGLGDYVTAATMAMGFRPCAKCHERAQRLNEWMPMGGGTRLGRRET
jgi:hypothetical protein